MNHNSLIKKNNIPFIDFDRINQDIESIKTYNNIYLIIHPLTSSNVNSFHENLYVNNLKYDIIKQRTEGKKIVWLVDTCYGSNVFRKSLYERNIKKNTTKKYQNKLEAQMLNFTNEQLNRIDSNLGISETDLILMTMSCDPLTIITSPFGRKKLEELFKSTSNIISAKVAGEKYNYKNGFSTEVFGCVNNVLGTLHNQNANIEIGPTFPDIHY